MAAPLSDRTWRRPGFTIAGYAAAAASKNHRLGTAHQFDSATASDAGRKSGKTRAARAREESAHVSQRQA